MPGYQWRHACHQATLESNWDPRSILSLRLALVAKHRHSVAEDSGAFDVVWSVRRAAKYFILNGRKASTSQYPKTYAVIHPAVATQRPWHRLQVLWQFNTQDWRWCLKNEAGRMIGSGDREPNPTA